ncbi:helix-turn-helix transcriptional regulator [Ruoffia tabacinasalis]|uniref:helix-turn-helix transcriptional regulator n=1 Tax=Ruoffia tabacinasalis TaxID=87458 RepID=UPI003F948A25
MLPIQSYLDTNYTEEINLDSLASDFAISKHYLVRRFKALFGIAPVQYTLNRRIGHAQNLLQYSDETITKIAYTLEFNSPNNFNHSSRNWSICHPMTTDKHERNRWLATTLPLTLPCVRFCKRLLNTLHTLTPSIDGAIVL